MEDPFDYGPQHRQDDPFTARMRFHQSWYRAEVLKLPYGTGPKINSKTSYGNMLTLEDGVKGRNFLRPHIFEVAKRRVAESKGLVDRFRLFCNMLSSQPMCFNLFGPLVDDVEYATGLFKLLLPGEIERVDKVRFEYSPEPVKEYLKDRTAFDAFVEYTRLDGSNAFIGIETKLTESFSRKIFSQPSYWKWTTTHNSPWSETSWSHLTKMEVNQIWRDHLLAVALLNHPDSYFTAGHFFVIYHWLDPRAIQTMENYQTLLKPEDRTFSQLPLNRLIDLWSQASTRATDIKWLSNFKMRYLNFAESEDEYAKYQSFSH